MRTPTSRTAAFRIVEDGLIDRLDADSAPPPASQRIVDVEHGARALAASKLARVVAGPWVPGIGRSVRATGERRKGAKAAKARLVLLVGCKCEACETQMPSPRLVHLHHILPVSEGGHTERSNLILLCPNCHAKAHWIHKTLDPSERPATRQAVVDILARTAHV